MTLAPRRSGERQRSVELQATLLIYCSSHFDSCQNGLHGRLLPSFVVNASNPQHGTHIARVSVRFFNIKSATSAREIAAADLVAGAGHTVLAGQRAIGQPAGRAMIQSPPLARMICSWAFFSWIAWRRKPLTIKVCDSQPICFRLSPAPNELTQSERRTP